jgi:hypothetical protein
MTLVGCFYVALATITLLGYPHHDPSVEVLSRERTLQKLVSPSQQPVSRRQRYAEVQAFGFNDFEGDVSATED